MSATRTSQAVEELSQKWTEVDSEIISRHSAKNCRAMQGIVAKFRRMEEALRRCQELAEDATSPNEALVMVGQIRVVTDLALAFDPLTPRPDERTP